MIKKISTSCKESPHGKDFNRNESVLPPFGSEPAANFSVEILPISNYNCLSAFANSFLAITHLQNETMSETIETPKAFGPNAWLIEEMFRQYRENPAALSESWRDFFTDYRPLGMPVETALPPAAAAPAPQARVQVAASSCARMSFAASS